MTPEVFQKLKVAEKLLLKRENMPFINTYMTTPIKGNKIS